MKEAIKNQIKSYLKQMGRIEKEIKRCEDFMATNINDLARMTSIGLSSSLVEMIRLRQKCELLSEIVADLENMLQDEAQASAHHAWADEGFAKQQPTPDEEDEEYIEHMSKRADSKKKKGGK